MEAFTAQDEEHMKVVVSSSLNYLSHHCNGVCEHSFHGYEYIDDASDFKQQQRRVNSIK